MIVSRLISLERRLDDPGERRVAMLELLAAHRRMIDAAVELIHAGREDTFARSVLTDKAAGQWMADADALYVLVQAYREGDLSSVENAMRTD